MPPGALAIKTAKRSAWQGSWSRFWSQSWKDGIGMEYVGEAVGDYSGAIDGRWVARSGKVRQMELPRGWLTVGEALELPLPDTSWMDEPWPREKFTGWMG